MIHCKDTSDEVDVSDSNAFKDHQGQTVQYDTSKMRLKREIGLPSGVSFVVGAIIGSGIFITPQGVLRNTGSVGLCLTVWVCGAIMSLLGSLTYTEVISVTRKSGGDYGVFMKTFGSVPAFVYVWTAEVARNPASLAVQGLTFSEYLSAIFTFCGSSDLIKKLVAISMLILLAVINTFSVKLSARIQIFFTIAKLFALAMIIIGGIIKISQGTVSELPTGFDGSITSISSLALAFYSVMFTYAGWNNVYCLIEEVKNPRRNGPLSSVVGVMVVGVIYSLTNVSYLAVMTRQELYQSAAVAQTWGEKVIGSASWIIPICVMMSVFGSANGNLATTTRIQFAAARDGNWWDFLSFVQVKRYTPLPAIVIRVVLACVMVIQGTVTSLITFLSFASWLFAGVSALCCIILRFRVKDDPKRIKVPLLVSVLFMLWCLFLVVAPIVENAQIEFLYASVFIVGGVIFYFPLVYLNIKPKFMDTLEIYLQLLLEVSPSVYIQEDSYMNT